MAIYNILLMAMVKVFPGYSIAQSGDKSKIINSFELKILTERVGGMG